MAEIPAELQENQDAAVVLARMKGNTALAGFDTSSGSPVNMVLAPVSIEVAQAYQQVERTLWRSRVIGPEGMTAAGDDLIAIVKQFGLDRLPGEVARGFVRFTGPNGTSIPAGTVVTTLGPNQLRFTTNTDATIPAGLSIDVLTTATQVGVQYNVPTGAIQLLEQPIVQTSVTNPVVFEGGVNVESDEQLTARFLDFTSNPPNGSNPAQYRAWAREVVGVGAAQALRPGEPNGPLPGGVDLYITDSMMLPASQVLVDAVQDKIAPPRTTTLQAESAPITVQNANGVSIFDRPDDVGTSRRMVYHASGPGEIRIPTLHTQLVQAGDWTIRPRWVVNSAAGSANMVTIYVQSVSNAQVARASAASAFGTATYTIQANDVLTAFSDGVFAFYWDGVETLELRLQRLTADTTTTLDIDSFLLRSNFSSYEKEGLAPILDLVTVRPAPSVPIAVIAGVRVLAGYAFSGAGGVQSAVQASITAYLQSLALVPDELGGNDVIYGEVGATVQNTPGVDFYDPATFRVNGGTANVAVGKHQVATPGTYTITEI